MMQTELTAWDYIRRMKESEQEKAKRLLSAAVQEARARILADLEKARADRRRD
jgi:hypothetical protein